MKLFKIALLAIAAFSLGGCVSAPIYRPVPVVVPAGSPPPQVIYVREYPYPYYSYPMFSWRIGFGYHHGWRR